MRTSMRLSLTGLDIAMPRWIRGFVRSSTEEGVLKTSVTQKLIASFLWVSVHMATIRFRLIEDLNVMFVPSDIRIIPNNIREVFNR